jgi:hypothetical protein
VRLDSTRTTTAAHLAWPADPPYDQERTRRARERLLDSGLLAAPVSSPGVREVIQRSWRRCVGDAVPVRPHAVPYCEPADVQPRLRAAAAPVLDRLSEGLSNVRVAMFLSDEHGRILMRRANEPGQRGILDNACAAEGFDFSEGSIGTNGLGTVVRERRPLLVHGCEHYNELLEPLTCAGTPIFEPFTRQLLGTFALACHSGEANPLMCAMATEVGRQIEGNLTAMLGAHERALIQSYLLATRSDREPVIVVTERTAFANSAGLSHFTAEAHALLWLHLTEAGLRRGRHRARVPLPAGWCDAVVEHVDGAGPAASAYCIRLLGMPGAAAEPARRRARTGPPDPVPRLHPLPDVNEQLGCAVRLGECLAVDGAPGTGKLHAATAAVAQVTGAAPLVVDIARSACPSTLDSGDGRAVVLRHLHDASPRDVNRIKAAIEEADVPVAVTVDLDAADEHVRALVAQLCTTVRLPSLREMYTHVPRLVSDILRELPAEQRATRFSSDALQVLMRWSWPGNVAELRRTVEQLARRRAGRTVGVVDLPSRMQQVSPRGLGMIESAERAAIVTALQRAGGNRSKAAEALGIGRTTLYRKLQTYRITVESAPGEAPVPG